jgi:1,4-dihydroxy-2-naphthoate octaprenyltransferase
MTEHQRVKLLKHIRPIHLLTTITLYLLGAGLARYLGQRIDQLVFLVGLSWLVFLQLGFYFLGDHFRTPFDPGLLNRLPFDSKDLANEGSQPGELLLYISLSCFAATGVITIIMGLQGVISISIIVLMGLIFAGFFLLTVPGISLDQSGLGEIITSITLVILSPAIAFILQYEIFHRLLVIGIIPLFPLHLAMILFLRLGGYREDIKRNRKSILVRIGWKQGLFLHNLMILSGFLLFGISLIFGSPIRLVGYVFLALPAALYLIWSLSQLEDGAPVRWPVFILLSLVVFFLPVYFLTFSSWIR